MIPLNGAEQPKSAGKPDYIISVTVCFLRPASR
jgi:hypothetical protein